MSEQSEVPTNRSVGTLLGPDSELPPELRSEEIREVRDVSSYSKKAYQIVFDQHYLPFSYWNPKPEGWEITYARTEYHQPDRFLGWLFPNRECITIVVSKEVETDVFQ